MIMSETVSDCKVFLSGFFIRGSIPLTAVSSKREGVLQPLGDRNTP
jgi:hypothetical protein